MNRINRLFVTFVNWITLIILIPLAVSALFFHRGVEFNTFNEATIRKGVSPFLDIFFIGVILFLLFGVFILFYNETSGVWVIRIGMMVTIVITGTIAIWWIIVNPFYPVADQAKTWTAAVALAKGTPIDADLISYFDTCPAQKVMAELMTWVIRAFGDSPIVFRFLNVVWVVLTSVGIVLCYIELSSDNHAVIIIELLLTIFFPVAMYASFVYGQIPAMCFCVVSFYGVMKYFKSGNGRWMILTIIFMPLSIISYQSTMICFIALAIIMIVKSTSCEIPNRWIVCVAGLISICMISAILSFVLKTSFDNKLGTVDNPGKGIPSIAYISMGLNSSDENDMPGAFDASHREMYLMCDRDSGEASKLALESVKQSIHDFLSGKRSIRFFAQKTEYQWLDPWFGGATMTIYGVESGDEYFDRLITGNLLPTVERFLYILMLFVYIGAIVCQMLRVRYGCSDILFCFPNIYFIGGFIFQMFWEQKSRYCLPYYLALFPLAACGISGLFSHYRVKIEIIPSALWKRIYFFMAAFITLIIAGAYQADKSFDFPANVLVGDDGSCCSQELALYPGDYHINLQYTAHKDTEIALYLTEAGEGIPAVLSSDEDGFEFDLHLDEYTDVLRFRYMIDSPEDFKLQNIHVDSQRALFTDHIFMAATFLIGAIYFLYLLSHFLFSERTIREKIWIAVIHLAVILVSLPLFSSELFWGADAPAHLMRLDGTRDAFLGREFPAFIYPRNDEGYGILGFMYPGLFLYVPAVLRVFRVSVPFAFNLLYLVINISGALVAYISSKPIFAKKEIRYLYTLLYVLLPYRLVNIYTRADLGEALAMVFIPLVISGLYICICEESELYSKRAICYLTAGMTGIINSHVLSSVMVSVFIVLYSLIFVRCFTDKRRLRIIAISAMAVFLINLWYIIPFVRLYLFGLNTSYLTDRVFTGRYTLMQLLGIHDFSDGTAWGGIALSGLAGLLVFILTRVLIKKKAKDRRDVFMIVSCVIAILLFITIGSEFPWERLERFSAVRSVTGIMQFSFRVMTIAAPLVVLVTAYGIEMLVDKGKIYNLVLVLVSIVSIITIIPGILGELKAEPYMNRLTGGASEVRLREYWPAGVTDGVFNDDRLYWSSEELKYENYEKHGAKVSFDYYTMSDKDEWIEPPVMYYPGYTATLTDENGSRKPIEVYQGDYYRIKVELPAAQSTSHVNMRYGGLWYFYLGYITSFITAVLFVVYILKFRTAEEDNT